MEFKKEELIKSPLNYTGGKFKLLPQILPLLPNHIDTFVDLFAGGLDMSLNIRANKIIINDIILPLIDMYKEFNSKSEEHIISKIETNIKEYKLNKTNNDGYLELRKNYNTYKNDIELMTLISYCYNNQIRFNSKWGFNRAFGKDRSEFNPSIRMNLINMINKIHKNNYEFTSINYKDFNFSELKQDDFVYLDPPYLITNADYSIQASWNDNKEIELLNLLDVLNNNNIKFALSNVLEHNGKTNNILLEWSGKYNVHYLNHTYSNANAVKKIKDGKSKEVLITNY